MSSDLVSAPAGLPPVRSAELSGWGRFPVETNEVYRPERISELVDLVRRAPQPTLIARGLGRGYGDAALNRAGAVVQSERLDRMLGFDPDGGILTCEAAVSLADILDTFLPRGWFLPLTPGTKFVTVGGAIAADVHGKNHHRSGSMAACVVDFRLVTAGGEILTCSREENADVFRATLGGMGLTGIVLEARLRLRRVPSAWMRVHVERLRNLDAVLERCRSTDRDYDYGVAWIDCLSRGESLGRSVLMRANHAGAEAVPAASRNRPFDLPGRFEPTVPLTFPDFALNPLSVRAFNALYYHGHGDRLGVVDCNRYFYPLDSVHQWNRIYGRRGMIQYQCVLPHETAGSGLKEILEELSGAGLASFLAVLKSFGEASGGLLSFPRPGFTLALDLPYRKDLEAHVRRLDGVVVRNGGRIYLAKDAMVAPDVFREMYPDLPRFLEVKSRIDPEGRFASSQSRRLGITPET